MSHRRSASLFLLATGIAIASGQVSARAEEPTVCLILESAAETNALPVWFLTRVIWRESRFDPHAIGPLTRSGERANGIAQFMPGTAAERDLADPFDPVQALPKAAALLRDLRTEFGNLGLAAAAYNAGPQRVHDWLAGKRGLPAETRNYVLGVTGKSVDDWVNSNDDSQEHKLADCTRLIAALKQAPDTVGFELERRVEQSARRPWSVILAAGFSRQRALSFYALVMQRYASILGTHDPIITRGVLRSRGTRAFFQVAIGAETRAAANRLCDGIRKAAGACIVNRAGRWAEPRVVGTVSTPSQE